MSETVKRLFAAIAKKYDVINTMLTLNIDKSWRKKAANLCKLKDGDTILDLCCGTGEMCLQLSETTTHGISVTGMDFSKEMLEVAREKIERTPYKVQIKLIEGDILALPFSNAVFDAVTIAFGIRNIADKQKALSEIYRVLKHSGRFICLELSQVDNRLLRPFYSLYFNRMLPLVGYLVSGDKTAYSYLRDSVNNFLNKSALQNLITECGFSNVEFQSLTGGIASIHSCIKK